MAAVDDGAPTALSRVSIGSAESPGEPAALVSRRVTANEVLDLRMAPRVHHDR